MTDMLITSTPGTAKPGTAKPGTAKPNPANQGPPGLFSAHPTAILALLAAGTGAIGLASLGVEIWTDRWLARTAELGVAYVSAPLGVATIVLAALTARTNARWAAPAFVLATGYWAIFALA